MTRRSLGGVGVLILVAGAALFFFTRTSDAPDSPDGDNAVDTAKAVEAAGVKQRRVSSDSAPTPSPAVLTTIVDPDPEGDLRLEGQVLGPNDEPIGGAIVSLSSNPPQIAISEEDGSFAFTSLVSKTYALSARSDEFVGGPVVHRLTESSDPAVVRLRQGAIVQVEVVSALDGTPIADALVSLLDTPRVSDVTDRSGSASLRGAAPGFSAVEVSASGFATQTVMMRIPASSREATRQRVELEPGVIIAGKVVGPDGRAVEGATVRAVATGTLARAALGGSEEEPIQSDASGAFEIPGVGLGTYRFAATHPKYAPGSSPPIDVGPAGAAQDIVISLEPGGTVAGLVVDSSGAPAPWATVRLSSGGDNVRHNHRRQTIAGDDGRFRIEGVTRSSLVAIAETETAASEQVEIDLESRERAEDVTLTLSLEGTISGSVVDGTGEPLAEAQVIAQPDFWAGEDVAEMRHRGPRFATTDGGGHFVLRGLANGKKFQLRAARGEISATTWQRKGTGAATGDTGIRLVVPADGSIEGTLRLAGGGVPEVATVSAGWAIASPATEGKFSLRAVPPGTYDVTVRGPDFPEKTLTGIEVEAGKTAAIGAIELAAGRKIAGRVVDDSGRPVAGADVVVARQIVGDGRSLTASGLGDVFEQQSGMRRAVADGSGRFVFKGVGLGDLVIAAEASDRGRSQPEALGAANSGSVTLRLRPFGGIEGTVTKDGKPASGAQIMVTPLTSQKQIVVVNAGPEGTFAIDRIGAGDYTLTARAGFGAGAKASARVAVPAGARADGSIDIKTGDKTVQVTVSGADGAELDGAQVFLFEGRADARVASEINKIYLSATGWAESQFARPKVGAPAVFKNVPDGAFTACIIPITGNLGDPTFAQRLQRHAESLKVYCEPLEIASSPAEQAVTRSVPAMEPLPED